LDTAAIIIAELGVDMSVFANVSQLTSWAGVCPGNNESAGKRKSSRIPKGNVYLKTALVEAANSAAKAKGTYLRDKFYRLKAVAGTSALPWPSPIRSWWPSITCFPSKFPTTIWAIFTSTNSTNTISRAIWSIAWNVWAIK
jgi:transposase